MKFRLDVPALALVMALAGCGGGERVSMAQAPAAQQPTAQQASQQPQAQQADPTTGALRVFQAFYGRAPTAAEFNAFSSPNSMVLATGFAAGFAGSSDAALTSTVLGNMGVTAATVNAASLDILRTALTQYFAAYGASARGVIVNNLVGLLAGLGADATWGAAARGFNTSVDSARAVVTASTGSGGACVAGVATGFQGDIETAAANAGAGDGGSGGSGGGAAAGGGLGKVLGGTMTVTDLATGNVVGQGTTDSATGLVTIRTCSLAGPFLLRLEGKAGARYFDEGRNALVDFPAGSALHALVDQWDEHVGVSPLTEAAYRYALNNYKANAGDIAAGRASLAAGGSLVGLTRAQVVAANELVRAQVNERLTANYQLASARSLSTPIDSASNTASLNDSRYGRSAAVNGGLVRAASDFNAALAAPALTLANDLARDLTDGRINGFALDGSEIARADRSSYESVRLPAAASIGANAVAGRFGTRLTASVGRVIDEMSFTQVDGVDADSNFNVDCQGFRDAVALMSDATVTVLRMTPNNVNGVCHYSFTPADFERQQKITRFITDVKYLSTGGSVNYAVKTDGTVVGWGENFCGRLNPGLPNGKYPQPVTIPGLRDVTSIRSDWRSVIARDRAGTIYTWGFGGRDTRLGGNALCGTTPRAGGTRGDEYQDTAMRRYDAFPNAIEVYTSADTYFVLTSDGKLYGWGAGGIGMLANSDGTVDPQGNLSNFTSIATPTQIAGLGVVRKFAIGSGNAYVLEASGTVRAWGSDYDGYFGGGRPTPTPRPVVLANLTNIAQMEVTCCRGLRLRTFDGTYLTMGGLRQDIRSGAVSVAPRRVTPPEPIRHFAAFHNSIAVFFTSGKVTLDFEDTYDQTGDYR
ncbi:RCC1 domain-containing protein [Ramlibacter albus]|uniref:Uncharacterized protein n=1 Tax=Ramlibacter albus TaxID=2079448 RepID=A0A923M851_9BURK|nr:hypothetical protein [Ramlibacter albus]MBC5764591.1 hypothetical protein [Ramlibacter albus]